MAVSWILVAYVFISGTLYDVPYARAGDVLPAGKANSENVIKPDTLPVVRRLKVKTVTATTMEAEWINPNAHVRGYRVTCESGKSVHADFNTTRHSWKFTDLTPGAEYVIRVQTIEPGGSAYGNAVSVSARTRALQPPSRVQVSPTCEGKVIASWEYDGDLLTGFELEFCDEIREGCIRNRTSATDRNATFDVPLKHGRYTFHIQSCLQNNDQLHLSETVEKNISTSGKATPVDSLEARFLNDTTLQVTWKTANAGATYIRVCPVSPSERNCTVYTTNGDSLEYQIYNVGREPEYEVLASFSPLEEGLRCIDAESSVTVRRPPPAGGHNSGSSTGVCGLLMLAFMLLPVLNSS